VIDYHLHLWSHSEPSGQAQVEQIAAYFEKASSLGVSEIAITEHFYRFRQARELLSGFFRRYPESPVRSIMEHYWESNSTSDLDTYVSVVQLAKQSGLNVVLGLEVDYYPGEMDRVKALLSGYPFDVLLGSVHWIEAWPFDHVGDEVIQAYWHEVGVEGAWERYTRALEELAATSAVDVLAHPDLIKVAGLFPKVPEEFYDRMAEAAKSCGVVAEVSSAGARKPVGEIYPAPYLLERFRALKVPITMASDAHGLGDVADRAMELRNAIQSVGYDSLAVFRGRSKEVHLL
jgi:histidinol-phosphatase (PHP family)